MVDTHAVDERAKGPMAVRNLMSGAPMACLQFGREGGLRCANPAALTHFAGGLPKAIEAIGANGDFVILNLEEGGEVLYLAVLQASHPGTSLELGEMLGLPPRQAAVAELVRDGLSDREISEEMGLSHYTVRTYLRRVYRRLQVNSRTQLVAVMDGRPL